MIPLCLAFSNMLSTVANPWLIKKASSFACENNITWAFTCLSLLCLTNHGAKASQISIIYEIYSGFISPDLKNPMKKTIHELRKKKQATSVLVFDVIDL